MIVWINWYVAIPCSNQMLLCIRLYERSLHSSGARLTWRNLAFATTFMFMDHGTIFHWHPVAAAFLEPEKLHAVGLKGCGWWISLGALFQSECWPWVWIWEWEWEWGWMIDYTNIIHKIMMAVPLILVPLQHTESLQYVLLSCVGYLLPEHDQSLVNNVTDHDVGSPWIQSVSEVIDYKTNQHSFLSKTTFKVTNYTAVHTWLQSSQLQSYSVFLLHHFIDFFIILGPIIQSYLSY